MLRMPPFVYHAPSTAEDAVAAYHDLGNAMYIAGGTDLLPNIKHRLFTPAHLVGLGGLPRGRIEETDTTLRIDAGVTLDVLSRDPLVNAHVPALSESAGLVAGPQLRRMGTLGGNVLLDTRCLYYNQTEFWRKALGYCLKKEGTWCHVIGGPKTCVAAQSSDTVPVLLALDATLTFLGPTGPRTMKIRDLYRFNGMDHLKIEGGELLTRIDVPKGPSGHRGTYRKLRMRDAIDFPQLGVAVVGTWEGAVPTSLAVVVGAANPAPKPIRGLDAYLGKDLDETALEEISRLVMKQTRPQDAVQGESAWRRAMAGIFVRRALLELRDRDT